MATLRELRYHFAEGQQKFWSMEELKAVIGVKDARTAKKIFGVDSMDKYRIGGVVKYWGADVAKRLDTLKEDKQE